MFSLANEISRQIEEIQIEVSDFEFFRELMYQLTGVSFSEKKMSLVASRLNAHVHQLGLDSFSAYRKYIENLDETSTELQTFINLLTTNKTDFFRESQHFDLIIEKIIPTWKASNKSKVSAWCCASSTGEEPYTLSMVLSQNLPKNMKYEILATDIDTKVLNHASNGVYATEKLAAIPEVYRKTSVTLGQKSANGWFKINDTVFKNIAFQQYNLNENSDFAESKFDLVFCRNVLIYFDQSTIRTLIQKIHRSLKPKGILIIGHSEAIPHCRDLFQVEQPSVYTKI